MDYDHYIINKQYIPYLNKREKKVEPNKELREKYKKYRYNIHQLMERSLSQEEGNEEIRNTCIHFIHKLSSYLEFNDEVKNIQRELSGYGREKRIEPIDLSDNSLPLEPSFQQRTCRIENNMSIIIRKHKREDVIVPRIKNYKK